LTNLEKYNKAFMTALTIEVSQLGKDLLYNSVASWDSIGHMTLIAALEDEFDILMEMEDILEFDSYENGLKLVAKYEVKF